jgi:hypothetical protein
VELDRRNSSHVPEYPIEMTWAKAGNFRHLLVRRGFFDASEHVTDDALQASRMDHAVAASAWHFPVGQGPRRGRLEFEMQRRLCAL